MSILANVLLMGVDTYRTHGSPRTGPCPHRMCHGGRSCSAFGRAAIQRSGAVAGLRLIVRRLRRCKAAATRTAQQATGGDATASGRRGRRTTIEGTAVTCCLLEAILSILPCNS